MGGSSSCTTACARRRMWSLPIAWRLCPAARCISTTAADRRDASIVCACCRRRARDACLSPRPGCAHAIRARGDRGWGYRNHPFREILAEPGDGHAFFVKLASTGAMIEIGPRTTILQALRRAGIAIPSSCETERNSHLGCSPASRTTATSSSLKRSAVSEIATCVRALTVTC